MKVALNVSVGESEDAGEGECINIIRAGKTVIEKVLEAELQELMPESKKCEVCEISITILDSDEMRSLNGTYRNINEATDVLSFPLIESQEDFLCPYIILGDIVICPDEVKKLHENLKFKEAIYLMIAHSFLHLVGWDHDTEEKEEIMWQRQEQIKDRIIELENSEEF